MTNTNTKPWTAADLLKNEYALRGINGVTLFTDQNDSILVTTLSRDGRHIAHAIRMSREDARREWDDLRASGLCRVR